MQIFPNIIMLVISTDGSGRCAVAVPWYHQPQVITMPHIINSTAVPFFNLLLVPIILFPVNIKYLAINVFVLASY